MYTIEITGGHPLCGSTLVQGAKNSVLPILAATVLCEGTSVIQGCPHLEDVTCALEILEYAGCRCRREGNTVTVDASVLRESRIPFALMHKMRSSITFLGAMTARCGRAEMSFPGGCELGPRPIDLHIKALKEIGIRVSERGGCVRAELGDFSGGRVHLDFPSVGATENLMMAAVLSKGETVLTNAAKEPEICDLQNFLNKMGARVQGAGTDEIRIEGVPRLKGTEHRVIPDRIVAATYLCAGAMTGGRLELRGAEPEHVGAVLSVLRDAGAKVEAKGDRIFLAAPERIRPVKLLRTMPYPGFPTDAQALVTAMLTLGDGTSMVEETIFENRFKHCGELCRMGADITTRGRIAVIRGVPRLTGARVEAMELRGGAALVIAGLAAEGVTEVRGTSHIDRGYDTFIEDMQALGAQITKH
ncbi:MAG: UDP-N-acetylglucosamine 1-carboxyvinyltransferase [Clostridia bacterium]|nr:UDP-N-acetylglucosamine 1-carboxyvinyltransferase [Oscillospiraceae bacterium]MBQ7032406.1 UDP-N-acetylglucosamine 1-carboxyvinyltransferase [Clostridia bacterium]